MVYSCILPLCLPFIPYFYHGQAFKNFVKMSLNINKQIMPNLLYEVPRILLGESLRNRVPLTQTRQLTWKAIWMDLTNDKTQIIKNTFSYTNFLCRFI